MHEDRISLTQDILRIGDQLVTLTDACIHLGNKVNRFVMDDDDCALKASRFIGQVNRLLGNFGFLSSDVRSRLFTAYCTSFYGAQLWTLGSSSWTRVIVAWRKAVRRVLKLPYQTRTRSLTAIHGILHVFLRCSVMDLRVIQLDEGQCGMEKSCTKSTKTAIPNSHVAFACTPRTTVASVQPRVPFRPFLRYHGAKQQCCRQIARFESKALSVINDWQKFRAFARRTLNELIC
ncbi:hypothetical protein CAPTEDRAFT_186474 [Capitella teleta]|uniref:Alkylated DNA repair protein AlkB homologue 8 N-terminal domain-containing protein n=1 Tax=Capitella teleta TaxID=283909 RepID=R7TX96_CAPTE|nr:hypothetical protein CAPTEDRAFT_186474 [Capitella teleta]|eukprot:ELT98314.1 hypothetical protein CAPTEDRAFT_186474 [Capitella teleta]